MNKYLAMLKSEKSHGSDLPKLPKAVNGGFGSFGSAVEGQFPENERTINATYADDCDGLPVADGVYFPWSAPVTPEQVRQWQADLGTAIRELAALQRWPEDMTERVRYRVERQYNHTIGEGFACSEKNYAEHVPSRRPEDRPQ